MQLMRIKTAIILASAFGCAHQAEATTVYSQPVGMIKYTMAAAAAGATKVSVLSPNLRLPMPADFQGKSRGVLTAVTDTTLTDSSAGWLSGSLSNAATPYFIRMRSGAASGAMWQISTAASALNTGDTVTVISMKSVTPVLAGIMPGDEYEIIPADTLATFFGDQAQQIGGASAALADAVRLYDGTAWKEYYYNTSSGVWREGSIPVSRSNIVIRPDAGMVYLNRSGLARDIWLIGNVTDVAEAFLMPASGIAFWGGVYPLDRALGATRIELMQGFAQRTDSLAAADKVRVFDGLAWREFHFSQTLNQWREGAIPVSRNSFVIPAGSPVMLIRGAGESMSHFSATVMPYAL